jgi:RNA polymerase sigma-70 factor (ECF subfamily)
VLSAASAPVYGAGRRGAAHPAGTLCRNDDDHDTLDMTDQDRDAKLMRDMQAGDRGALETLYDHYAPLLLGLAMRILRDRADAEDALQEAWVQVWKRCGSYQASRGSVAAWLVTIARTRALDRYRSRVARQRAETGPPVAADAGDPTAHGGAIGHLNARLAGALAALDPRHRRVIEIAYFEGLSQREIAERLEVPLGTVKHWTREGLMTLRAAMPKDAWT